MKNLLLRKAMLDRERYLYEIAIELGFSTTSLQELMHYDWPENIQKDVIDLMDKTGKKDKYQLRKEILKFVSAQRTTTFGNAGGYATRVMNEVQEWELRREKEREGWY